MIQLSDYQAGVINMPDKEPILATGGYDHTIKIWSPHSATSVKTLQHSDSQVKAKYKLTLAVY